MRYLDYAGACPVRPEIAGEYLHLCQQYCANPHGLSKFGEFCRRAIQDCERRLLATLGIPEGEASVIWCSNATEALNLAITGFLALHPGRVLYDPTAHPAMLEPLQAAVGSGTALTAFGVTATGKLQAGAAARRGCGLLCVCHVNNETGVGQDLPALRQAEPGGERQPVLCVDAAQSYGKIAIPWYEANIGLLALSARKLGGPAGMGALVIRRGLSLRGQTLGGGQQHKLRSGTVDTVGVQMFTAAAEISCRHQAREFARLQQLNQFLRTALAALPPDFCHALSPADAIPHILCLSFPGREGAIITRWLAERKDLLVGSGSACSAESPEPSHVLRAMGYSAAAARSGLRLSLGYATQQDDLEAFLAALPDLAAEYPLPS
ncbi:MAG: aminotransferase class V-fold PLP-dependent enzyme [Oligosphaeraceae bacterium]|nr:aminotransferase class V-fold PLP-dependent enzyme [Oligosphaeraceae bacterium]